MTRKQIQTIVVDDHHLFRSGIVALLGKIPNVEVTGEAADGQKALEVLANTNADVVLLDLEMPVMDGLETCKAIRKQNTSVYILVLSWHRDSDQLRQLLQAGANGFISKSCTKQELQNAINIIAHGGNYFSESLTEVFSNITADNNKTIQDEGRSILTDREQEVLECIANEYTNKEIAVQLFISQRTVETHRRNLIQKLKVKNTVGLVKFYLSSTLSLKQTVRINT
ncbi:MAG: response regulator [Saprospiraceae bacterium]